MTIRNFSNTATDATLTGGISSGDLSFALTSFSGYPAPPFTAAIERGADNEEIVLVTGVSVSTVTCTRGYDGTTAKSHNAAATFLHVSVAKDYNEANTHVNATSGAHGVSGTIVGTSDAQTLTNKALTTPTIASPTISGTETVAASHVTGTLTADGLTTLGVVAAGNTGVTGTLNVSGVSTLAATSVTTLNASGAVVGTGNVKGATLEATSAVLAAVLGSDPSNAGAAKAQTFVRDDNGLYLQVVAQTRRRLTAHWGAGTTFPTAAGGALAGDTYQHTGLACVMKFVGGVAWRQDTPTLVANASARTTISGTYSAILHEGFYVEQSDNGSEWVWTAGAWRFVGATTAGPPIVAITIAAGWTAVGGYAPGVYKDSDGLVHFAGAFTNNNSYRPTDSIFGTLPVGYRPARDLAFAMLVNVAPNTVTVTVETDGTALINNESWAGVGLITTPTVHTFGSMPAFHQAYTGSLPYNP